MVEVPPTRDPCTMSAQERLDEAASILARGLVRYLGETESSEISVNKPTKRSH